MDAEGPSIDFKTLPAESPRLESICLSNIADHNVKCVPSFQYLRSIFNSAWCASDHVRGDSNSKENFETFLDKMKWRWSKPLLQTLALLIAMVNCRIGLSAARWVRKYFVPAVIQYDTNNQVIGLLAKHSCPSGNLRAKRMMSVGRHLRRPSFGKDLVLVDFAVPSAPVGLIPDFLYEEGEELEILDSRMQVLCRGVGELVAPGKLDLQVYVP